MKLFSAHDLRNSKASIMSYQRRLRLLDRNKYCVGTTYCQLGTAWESPVHTDRRATCIYRTIDSQGLRTPMLATTRILVPKLATGRTFFFPHTLLHFLLPLRRAFWASLPLQVFLLFFASHQRVFFLFCFPPTHNPVLLLMYSLPSIVALWQHYYWPKPLREWVRGN